MCKLEEGVGRFWKSNDRTIEYRYRLKHESMVNKLLDSQSSKFFDKYTTILYTFIVLYIISGRYRIFQTNQRMNRYQKTNATQWTPFEKFDNFVNQNIDQRIVRKGQCYVNAWENCILLISLTMNRKLSMTWSQSIRVFRCNRIMNIGIYKLFDIIWYELIVRHANLPIVVDIIPSCLHPLYHIILSFNNKSHVNAYRKFPNDLE